MRKREIGKRLGALVLGLSMAFTAIGFAPALETKAAGSAISLDYQSDENGPGNEINQPGGASIVIDVDGSADANNGELKYVNATTGGVETLVGGYSTFSGSNIASVVPASADSGYTVFYYIVWVHGVQMPSGWNPSGSETGSLTIPVPNGYDGSSAKLAWVKDTDGSTINWTGSGAYNVTGSLSGSNITFSSLPLTSWSGTSTDIHNFVGYYLIEYLPGNSSGSTSSGTTSGGSSAGGMSASAIVAPTTTTTTSTPVAATNVEAEVPASATGVEAAEVKTAANGTAKITSLEVASEEATVRIPSTVTVDGVSYKVKTIGNGALEGCDSVKTLTIPKTVTKIEKGAFTGATSLKVVKLNVTKSITVQKGAFKGVSTKNMTIKVSKSMPNKQLQTFQKTLTNAGFKGKVKRTL